MARDSLHPMQPLLHPQPHDVARRIASQPSRRAENAPVGPPSSPPEERSSTLTHRRPPMVSHTPTRRPFPATTNRGGVAAPRPHHGTYQRSNTGAPSQDAPTQTAHKPPENLNSEHNTCLPTVFFRCQQIQKASGYSFGESLHCALLLDYVPPEEPPGTPLGNPLRIR